MDTAPPFGNIVMHCFLGLALTLGHGTQGGCDEQIVGLFEFAWIG